jgi:hypothetical protein
VDAEVRIVLIVLIVPTSVAVKDSKYGNSVEKSLPFIAYLSIAKIYFHIQAGDVRVLHVTSPALNNS